MNYLNVTTCAVVFTLYCGTCQFPVGELQFYCLNCDGAEQSDY